MNDLYCGDSTEILKTIPGESIDLVVTSPPYDNLRTYNGYCFDFERIANELYRVLKKGGVIVWVVNDATINGSESLTSFKQALYFNEIGLNVHDTMIWYKDSSSLPDKTRYSQCFEYMFIFSKGRPKTVNKICDRKNKYYGLQIHGTTRQKNGETTRKANDKRQTVNEYGERHNVWNMPSEKHNTTGHPAVFPERLAIDHIKTWSNPGDVVLDPFMGSGTTCVAAKKTNRQYIGCEISKEYFEISKKRINTTRIQMAFDDLIKEGNDGN